MSHQEIVLALSRLQAARTTAGQYAVPALTQWKDWYGALKSLPRRDIKADVRRIERLELENARLRQLVINLSADAESVKEA